jgi:hypothetical protein
MFYGIKKSRGMACHDGDSKGKGNKQKRGKEMK